MNDNYEEFISEVSEILVSKYRYDKEYIGITAREHECILTVGFAYDQTAQDTADRIYVEDTRTGIDGLRVFSNSEGTILSITNESSSLSVALNSVQLKVLITKLLDRL